MIPEKKILLPNVLLISGNGRNVGKTTYICQLINQLEDLDVIAIKISPHFHNFVTSGKIIENNSNYTIIEELKRSENKDSERMLKAGAAKVFFIMVKDDYLADVFLKIKPYLTTNNPIIIESAFLRKIIIPGLYFMIFSNENNIPKERSLEFLPLVNQKIFFDGERFSIESQKIGFNKSNSYFYIKT